MPASPLARLKAGTRDIRVVAWPGRPEVKVGLRPLTGREWTQARMHGLKMLEQAPAAARVQASYIHDEEQAFAQMWLSLVDPDSGERFASSIDELRSLCTVHELDELSTLYAAEFGQGVDDPLQEADRLGKAGTPGATSSGSSPTGRIPSSELPPSTSPTASSSTSSPDSDSTPRRREAGWTDQPAPTSRP